MCLFRPSPRPGGYLKMRMDVKEKKNKTIQFDQYKNIITRVEDMEKDKYRIEKTMVKNPNLPTITPIKNLNLQKISQESLFDKCLIENEDNGKLLIVMYEYNSPIIFSLLKSINLYS